MSSLGSGIAAAMMVSGGGAPPFAAWLGPDWIRVHWVGTGTVLFGWKPLSTLNAQPPELKHGLMTRAQGAAVS